MEKRVNIIKDKVIQFSVQDSRVDLSSFIVAPEDCDMLCKSKIVLMLHSGEIMKLKKLTNLEESIFLSFACGFSVLL